MSAAANGNVLGVAFPASKNHPLKAMSFTTGGQLYLAQVVKSFPLTVVIRGRQLLMDDNIEQGYSTRNSTYSEADLSTLAEGTDGNGFNQPASFSTPTGWTEKFDSEYGNKYYVLTSDIEKESSGDTDGDGVIDTQRSADTFIDKAVNWVKANQWLAVGIVVVAYFLLKPKKTGRGRGKSILGGLLA